MLPLQARSVPKEDGPGTGTLSHVGSGGRGVWKWKKTLEFGSESDVDDGFGLNSIDV